MDIILGVSTDVNADEQYQRINTFQGIYIRSLCLNSIIVLLSLDIVISHLFFKMFLKSKLNMVSILIYRLP